MIKDRKGMTLVEVMIVFAIIGILAAIIIPNVMMDKPHNENINHGMSWDTAYPSAKDALVTMENAGFFSPVITHDWKGEMERSQCAKSDRSAYSVTALNSSEREAHFLLCCRGTGQQKSCVILKQPH